MMALQFVYFFLYIVTTESIQGGLFRLKVFSVTVNITKFQHSDIQKIFYFEKIAQCRNLVFSFTISITNTQDCDIPKILFRKNLHSAEITHGFCSKKCFSNRKKI